MSGRSVWPTQEAPFSIIPLRDSEDSVGGPILGQQVA